MGLGAAAQRRSGEDNPQQSRGGQAGQMLTEDPMYCHFA